MGNVINKVVFGYTFPDMKASQEFDKVREEYFMAMVAETNALGASLPYAKHWLPHVAKANKALQDSKQKVNNIHFQACT